MREAAAMEAAAMEAAAMNLRLRETKEGTPDNITSRKVCILRPLWRRHTTGMPAAETSTHLEGASTSHRAAATSLLDQPEIHGGGFRCKGKHVQMCGRRDKRILHPSINRGDEHAP